MCRRTKYFLLALALVGCDVKTETDLAICKKNLELVFRDEFNVNRLDTLNWRNYSSSPAPFDRILPRGNCDFRNAAIIDNNNLVVEDGVLNLIAKAENKTYEGVVGGENGKALGCNLVGGESFIFEQNFTTASVFSRKGYQNGLFECRARIPSAKGLYPVFWLWHHDEIVVFEFFGDSNVHFVSAHNKEKYVTKKFSNSNYSGDFHSYAVYWDNENITWFYDESIIWKICRDELLLSGLCKSSDEPDNHNFKINESFPDSTNRWLSPNVSLRIYEWDESLDVDNLPDTLVVDHVSVYQSLSSF